MGLRLNATVADDIVLQFLDPAEDLWYDPENGLTSGKPNGQLSFDLVVPTLTGLINTQDEVA